MTRGPITFNITESTAAVCGCYDSTSGGVDRENTHVSRNGKKKATGQANFELQTRRAKLPSLLRNPARDHDTNPPRNCSCSEVDLMRGLRRNPIYLVSRPAGRAAACERIN